MTIMSIEFRCLCKFEIATQLFFLFILHWYTFIAVKRIDIGGPIFCVHVDAYAVGTSMIHNILNGLRSHKSFFLSALCGKGYSISICISVIPSFKVIEFL